MTWQRTKDGIVINLCFNSWLKGDVTMKCSELAGAETSRTVKALVRDENTAASCM
jgi:hypothetical protein